MSVEKLPTRSRTGISTPPTAYGSTRPSATNNQDNPSSDIVRLLESRDSQDDEYKHKLEDEESGLMFNSEEDTNRVKLNWKRWSTNSDSRRSMFSFSFRLKRTNILILVGFFLILVFIAGFSLMASFNKGVPSI